MECMTTIRNVVLVDDDSEDGTGWQAVYDELAADGFHLSVVQDPTPSLGRHGAATRHVLDALDSPAVLVGHSYGGVVVSEAGTHPNVAALVYIAAYAPDRGESAVTEPAWRHKPSWYLVATEDRTIPPSTQRSMAQRAGSVVVEAIGSHAIHISQPAAVANLIRQVLEEK